MNFVGAIGSIKDVVQLAGSALSYLRSRSTGTSEEQKILSNTISVMHDLIHRAEWRSHEDLVAKLLPELKDAVYDAEDLLDVFRCDEQKAKLCGDPRHSSSAEFVRNVFQDSSNKVSHILERLDNLSKQLGSVREAPQQFDKFIRPETSSFPIETKIFGRHNELEEVIKLLGVPTTIASNNRETGSKRKRANTHASQPSTSNHAITSALEATRVANVPVLPVVGMGGVGKTTLAQQICRHKRVTSKFDLIIWLCISDDFDVKRLTKEAVIRSSSSSRKETMIDMNLDSLQRTLANNIEKKKFLLVLDDMWGDALRENGQCWKRFCAPLTDVLEGSMILVTTRSREVADLVKTMEPFPLQGLKDGVFWDFFKLCAFGSETCNNYPELECIGRDIVPKLKGSPLAAKTLGRLLKTDLHTTHWNNILKSELWELKQEEYDILPALRLSYMYLPYYLKSCFSFCAVYPKDHKFEKDSLVDIWVAEGFVESQKGGILIRDVGCQYFDWLVNRSFFQKAPRSKNAYVIHDLMHDMAQLVSKDECFIIKDESDLEKVPPNVRHLSILTNRGSIDHSKLSSLGKYKKMRTLFYNGSLRRMAFDSIIGRWFRELGYIRVFCCDSINKLPESIGNLKHLRYIEISGDSPLKTLPASFCCLYNLQVLYAKKCIFESLAIDINKLVNLQRIASMYLQYESGNLSSTQADGEVLESLHPPTNLKSFCFKCYEGEYFPNWFQPVNLPNLTSLEVSDCHGLASISFSKTSYGIDLNKSSIPSMLVGNNIDSNCVGVFSSLTNLSIMNCHNLSSLQELLRPACLPAIKMINLHDCSNLVSLPAERFGDFRSLEELQVCGCPKISLSEGMLNLPSSLRILKLDKSGDLGYSIGYSTVVGSSSMSYLYLSYSCVADFDLKVWRNSFADLKKLEIRECKYPTLNRESQDLSFPLASRSMSSGIFASLTNLTIYSWKKLTSLDDLLTPDYLPAIERICVQNCLELVSLQGDSFGGFQFIKYLEVSSCPRLNWQNGLVLPSSLQELCLCRCGEDISNCIPGCLEELTSLVSLTLGGCPGITSIPGSLWASNLPALEVLDIWKCPDLVSIGGPKAMTKIKRVRICGCPELKQLKQPFFRRWSY